MATDVISLQDRLTELEVRHSASRADAIDALREIHDTREFWAEGGPLHDQYGTWEKYLKDRWNYNKTYGHYLLGFANLRNELKQNGEDFLPESEFQTRALVSAKRNAERNGRKLDVAAIWQRAKDTAPVVDHVPRVTGAHIESLLENEGTTRPKQDVPPMVREAQNRLTAFANSKALSIGGDAFKTKYGAVLSEEKAANLHQWLGEYLETG